MASIMGVGVMDLITRGQTLRTKANIYRTARDLGFIINVPRDKPTFAGKFKGAYVCEMKAGLYNDVIVYDFSSLYPSILSAANLCYTTFIHPRDWHRYGPDMYTSFNVSTSGGEKREVRFVKTHIFKGVIPRVVEGFLKARADTREELKKEKDPVKKGILDKKQLAIKVSNNSVYGAVGADFSSRMAALLSDICASSLGLKWIAMTVTEIGQQLIKGCTAFLRDRYGAVGIYGDTDSTFVTVPPLPPPADPSVKQPSLWERAVMMGDEFNKTLTPPLKIELEKIIRMVGLTAKRYLYRCQKPNGELKTDLNFKGVVATRRDTCRWQVQLFTKVAESILQDLGKDAVTKIIYREIIELMRGRVELARLLIGCSVAESYKSATCRMAILKNRMAEEGRPIAGGSRVQFFVTETPNHVPAVDDQPARIEYRSPYWRGPKGGVREDNVSARVRMLDEFVEGVTKIDYPYYVSHLAQNSVDQLFAAAFHGDTVIEPLVEGLRYNAEQTLREMEIMISRDPSS
jgi:DNA polymerase delta subunit 1